MGSYDVIFVIGFYYLYFKELVKNGLGIGFHHTDRTFSTRAWTFGSCVKQHCDVACLFHCWPISHCSLKST